MEASEMEYEQNSKEKEQQQTISFEWWADRSSQ